MKYFRRQFIGKPPPFLSPSIPPRHPPPHPPPPAPPPHPRPAAQAKVTFLVIFRQRSRGRLELVRGRGISEAGRAK